MKAVLIRRYGGHEVLEVADIEPPRLKRGEVLVRVHASSVNPIDWKIRNGSMKLIVRHPLPIVLGVDFAGEISATGEGASRFGLSEQVFGFAPSDIGANAEYVAVPEAAVAKKPTNISMDQAASLPAVAATALQALRRGGALAAGRRLLVNGASGGVGICAVQIARASGASVTGVCSAANADLVQRAGAERVIDYKSSDFVRGEDRYDAIFDCVGNRSFGECARVLNPGGAYVSTAPTFGLFLRSAFNAFGSKKAYPIILKPSVEDLEHLRDLVEQGRLVPIIDRTWTLAEIVEAHRYSESGRVRGKIVLSLAPSA